MIEILPLRLLTEEDAPIFGSLNVALGKLARAGLPVGNGIVITPPQFKLQAVLEHFDFGTKEIFEQSLTLYKKEIEKIPVPEVLENGVNSTHQKFFVNGKQIDSVKNLWLVLLDLWLDQIKERLYNNGFYKGITEGLDPQTVIFIKRVQSFGNAYFDSFGDDVVINCHGKSLHPNDLKKITDIVQTANKKLFIPHEYEWIADGGIKLAGVKQYISYPVIARSEATRQSSPTMEDLSRAKSRDSSLIVQNGKRGVQDDKQKQSAVKVFVDLSKGFPEEEKVDGVYISSEEIFDLDKPNSSFEKLVFRLVEAATVFPDSPTLFKLADKSEGMGKVRGTLRLLHQKSLLNPLLDALDFACHKKGLTNIHIVVPFARTVNEFLQIKRELAVKKLSRKNSLQFWLEVAVPENVVNLEEYLLAGLDGVVLNLDELVAHLNGFDLEEESLVFYKNEVDGLLKFLEDGIRLMHKSKIPFIAFGSLSLYPKVLEFLVEKGVYGIVMERYAVTSAKDLLNQTEKRMILRRQV